MLGILRTLVEEQPDATLPELNQGYAECTDQLVSPSTIGRALNRLDMTRKKVLPAIERMRPDVLERQRQS